MIEKQNKTEHDFTSSLRLTVVDTGLGIKD